MQFLLDKNWTAVQINLLVFLYVNIRLELKCIKKTIHLHVEMQAIYYSKYQDSFLQRIRFFYFRFFQIRIEYLL